MTAPDAPLARQLLRRKPVARLIAESSGDREPPPGTPVATGMHLKRSIGLEQLSAIGIGATVGTGIFFVLNTSVPEAGPAVVVSFVIAAATAGLTALCYAELASAIPVSGSSYSYAYATLGEIVAFGVGACLLLEYGVSASAVSVGWGQYLNELAQILRDVTGQTWPSIMFALGAIVSIFSVTLVVIDGQARILYTMGRDGMLPPAFASLSERSGTPVWNTVVVSVGVALLAGFVPLDVLADLTSLGTLVAFSVVSIGVMVLRRTHPDMPRGFRVPGYPVTPLLSIAACCYVISGLHPLTFGFFAAWLTGAAFIYFGYSVKHSRLRGAEQPEADPRRAHS